MKNYALYILISALFIVSCSDEEKDDEFQAEVKDIQFIDVSSYTDWVYFSFVKGEVVSVTDFKNDLSWDIAFHRGDVRLNGGASGKGGAEVVNTGIKEWSKVTEAPLSGYVKDEIGEITTSFTGSGTTEEEQPFSQVLTEWLTIDTSNPPPKYILSNWIYVLKAADGNFVKLWLYDNKNEKNAAGYVSFKYQYNSNGSANFN